MCTGLLVNGIRYSFGDEIVASTDVKIEPYWANTPETPFASTNLELSNPGSTDATFILHLLAVRVVSAPIRLLILTFP